jgi:hypothetical protein
MSANRYPDKSVDWIIITMMRGCHGAKQKVPIYWRNVTQILIVERCRENLGSEWELFGIQRQFHAESKLTRTISIFNSDSSDW